ncbi:MAG: PocR ligand-binding domain-containing protein [Opitutae bacterium]|nr:PocR ligand-binding domain-containing protein [Opitutae bacterium]
MPSAPTENPSAAPAPAAGLQLADLFDLTEIQEIQDAFARATGVASIITDPQGRPITRPSNFCYLCEHIIRRTPTGLANCMTSAATIGRRHPESAVIQPCLSGGLWDAGTSICVGDQHIANWLIGQVRDDAANDEQMLAYARTIGADEAEYRAALQQVPRMSREQFLHIGAALHLIGRQLSHLAYQNRQQAEAIAARRKAEQEREHLVQALALKNRELENVLYTASHDLRSPLLNIQGFSRRLAQACEDLRGLLAQPDLPAGPRDAATPIIQEQIPKALHFIRSGVDKMETLIGGLLRISRLGQVTLHLQTLDMNQLVQRTVAAGAFQIQEAGATIEVLPLPTCTGDATLLSQAFSNLIDNALKYRHADRAPRIRISGQIAGERVIYCVADNGIGIAPEHLEKIWELFRRLHPTGTTGGEGLGLTIVRRIVERHDGHVWVESAPGEGSRFLLALPLAGPIRAIAKVSA